MKDLRNSTDLVEWIAAYREMNGEPVDIEKLDGAVLSVTYGMMKGDEFKTVNSSHTLTHEVGRTRGSKGHFAGIHLTTTDDSGTESVKILRTVRDNVPDAAIVVGGTLTLTDGTVIDGIHNAPSADNAKRVNDSISFPTYRTDGAEALQLPLTVTVKIAEIDADLAKANAKAGRQHRIVDLSPMPIDAGHVKVQANDKNPAVMSWKAPKVSKGSAGSAKLSDEEKEARKLQRQADRIAETMGEDLFA